MTRLFRSPGRASARLAAGTVLGLALATLVPAGTATAAPGNACENRNNNTYEKLLECMTLEGVYEHLQQFQKIADTNDDEFYPGTRAAGTEGYAESVDVRRRPAAGRRLRGHARRVRVRVRRSRRCCSSSPRSAATYETGAFTGSGDGDVTGNVIPVDINLDPPRATHQRLRGLRLRRPGLQRAQRHRADPARGPPARAGLHVRRQGRRTPRPPAPRPSSSSTRATTPTREALIVGTLVPSPAPITIPVVGASFADGVALAQAGSTAHVRVLEPETRTDVNVIAELPGTNADNVVMAGAHLDSVTRGPGHQRQRLRLGRAARDRAADGQAQAGEHAAVRLVGRRGERPGRLDRVRRRAVAGGAGPDRAVPELRHGRLAQLHLHGLRRRPVDLPGAGGRADPGGLDRDRGPVRVVLHLDRRAVRRRASSPGAATTRPSSRPASRPAACSPAPRCRRPRSRRRSGAAPPASSSTRATTSPATTIDNLDLHALEVNSDLIAFAHADVRVLDRVGQRRPGQAGPGPAADPAGAGRAGGHLRLRDRRRGPGPQPGLAVTDHAARAGDSPGTGRTRPRPAPPGHRRRRPPGRRCRVRLGRWRSAPRTRSRSR